MTVISTKSITGVTSITSPQSDDAVTLHTNDTTQRVSVTTGGMNVTGVVTATSFSGNITGNISGGTVAGSTGTFTGDVSIADKIVHIGDTNTAIRFADADTFTVETGGGERLRIVGVGSFGINNSDPKYTMHFKNTMSSSPSWIHMEVTGSNTVGGGGGIAFDTSASNNASNNSLFLATIAGVRNSSDDGSNDLVFSTSTNSVNGSAPVEKLRITSAGKMGLGTNSPTALLHVTGGSSPTILNKPSDATPALFTGDSNRTSNGQHLAEFRGNWNGTLVSRMVFSAGDDTTNKDNGNIDFFTAAAGSTVLSSRIDANGILLKSGQASLESTSLSHPIQVAADSSAQNIVCFGRASDDISAIDFYEADKSTRLGELQYRQDHLNFRHRVGDMRFCTGGSTERLRIHSNGTITQTAGSGDNQFISKRSNTAGSNGNYFFHLKATDENDNIVGTLGFHRDTAADDSRLVLATRKTGASNVERLRLNSKGLISATISNGCIDGTYVYKQANQSANYEHKIRGPLGGLIDTEMNTNSVAYIKVQCTGTGTNTAYCYYRWSQDGENLGATLTHIHGNSGSSSNNPWMVLDGQHPCWKTAHSTAYTYVVRVEITGGEGDLTFQSATGGHGANP